LIAGVGRMRLAAAGLQHFASSPWDISQQAEALLDDSFAQMWRKVELA